MTDNVDLLCPRTGFNRTDCLCLVCKAVHGSGPDTPEPLTALSAPRATREGLLSPEMKEAKNEEAFPTSPLARTRSRTRERTETSSIPGGGFLRPDVSVVTLKNAQVGARAREDDPGIRNEDGVLVDRYSRTAETVAACIEACGVHAAAIRAALAAICAGGNVELGRLGGGRQFGRLDASARLFERVAERDKGVLAAFKASRKG